jgi:predicted ArsR family transcriptional regulator
MTLSTIEPDRPMFGIDSTRYQILVALREIPLTVPQLCALTGRTYATIRKHLSNLSAQGYVERYGYGRPMCGKYPGGRAPVAWRRVPR